MSVALPSTLTLVNDGETKWIANTAELAKALPQHYTLDWSFGRSYAVIEPKFHTTDDEENEPGDPGTDSYSALCCAVSAVVASEVDLDEIESEMDYEPATGQRGFVLRGAIRQAAIKAFAALESEGVQRALRTEGAL